jgi:ketosteroid isomerase-like protein
MAGENLDFVRALYADWERGDFSSADWASEDIAVVFVDGPTPGRLSSSELSEGWRGWLRAWDDYRVEAREYRLLEDQRVLVLGCMKGRGKLSGAAAETEIANLLSVRDGKVTELVMYSDPRRALHELGLQA